jgi:hypothetical protein
MINPRRSTRVGGCFFKATSNTRIYFENAWGKAPAHPRRKTAGTARPTRKDGGLRTHPMEEKDPGRRIFGKKWSDNGNKQKNDQ